MNEILTKQAWKEMELFIISYSRGYFKGKKVGVDANFANKFGEWLDEYPEYHYTL